MVEARASATRVPGAAAGACMWRAPLQTGLPSKPHCMHTPSQQEELASQSPMLGLLSWMLQHAMPRAPHSVAEAAEEERSTAAMTAAPRRAICRTAQHVLTFMGFRYSGGQWEPLT